MSQAHLPDPPIEQIREIAEGTMAEWLDGYQSVMNEDGRFTLELQFRQMDDGTWRVDDSDGTRANGDRGTYRISVTVERMDRPEGLCGNKADHEPHDVPESTVGPFRCHADQSMRLPYAAERRPGNRT